MRLCHVVGRPVTTLFCASRATAVSVVVPNKGTDAGVGVMRTEETAGSVTVTSEVAVFPPAVARMVANPAETPVTVPAPFTVATPVANDVQLTAGVVLQSCVDVLAVSETLAPTMTDVAGGLTASADTMHDAVGLGSQAANSVSAIVKPGSSRLR
jgi:hypothetical protein